MQRAIAVMMRREPATLTHPEMAAVVQNSTLLSLSLFVCACVSLPLSNCLSSNLKCSRGSGCATWTQATCQGLSTCLATSAPCESSRVSCSEAMAEIVLTPLALSLSHIFFTASQICHLAQRWPVVFCHVWIALCLRLPYILYLASCWSSCRQHKAI